MEWAIDYKFKSGEIRTLEGLCSLAFAYQKSQELKWKYEKDLIRLEIKSYSDHGYLKECIQIL